MESLDETDMELLRLLAVDARQSFRDLADAVDRSPPTVSDRIDRLCELGVIRRFTVDVDRSKLADGVAVLVDLDVRPAAVESTREALTATDGVRHVFTTADARVVFQANVAGGDVRGLLAEAVDLDAVREYDVSLLDAVEWSPGVDGTAFALECAECGNTVTAEGESSRLGGDLYHFCCGSCQARFEEQYAELSEAAED